MRVHRSLFCSFVLLAILGCGGSHRPVRQRVLLPPTLNLMPYHNIGLFQFSVENAKGNLHEFATHRFEEYVLAAQTGIEMREFTSADSSRVFAAASDSNGCPVAFIGGTPSFSARDPNDAYGRLINELVYNVTYDVRSTWVDQ